MNYSTLGRTGLQVSKLALGTVELGMDYGIAVPGHFGRPAEAEAVALVHAALDAGINFIDTARAYGTSERVVGKALQGRRQQAVLATKVAVAPDPDRSAAELRRQMEDSLATSLQELGTDYVDIWKIHNLSPEILARIDTVAEVFAAVQRSGKVRWVGASTYGAELPAAGLATGLFDLLQVTYSVFDQRLADQVLPAAAASNVGVVVRSVLLKGALTARADHLPDHMELLRARSRRYRQLVADAGLGLSPAQVAIAFALAHPQIGAVLVGIRSTDELAENLLAASARLPAEFLAQVAALRIDDPDLLNPGTWGIP